MSAEQDQTALDAGRLGQMVHQAMVRQVKRDGFAEEAVTRWESLPDTARGDFRTVAVAVARAALDAAVAHLRADLATEMRRARDAGALARWGEGYEDAIGELMALREGMSGEEVQP